MKTCAAVGGTCGGKCEEGWEYCIKHLQMDQVLAELRKTQDNLRMAQDEIAELSHPEFGEIGRLQEEINNLKSELAQAQADAVDGGV